MTGEHDFTEGQLTVDGAFVTDDEPEARMRAMLRVGAVCAILGAVVSVAAGMGFGNLTNEHGAVEVLRTLAARPRWYWPLVHLAFIVGAFLWVDAFIALAISLQRGPGWILGWFGAATLMVGAAIHVADSSISGFGLTALAGAWVAAPPAEQPNLLRIGETLLYVLHGTWPNVHSFFHGVPFILSGSAAALSRRYPQWLGWVGTVGGAGSLVGGVLMFFGAQIASERFFIVFAQLVSLWMVAMGILMWRHATRSATARTRVA
jgi:hypothetical protein